MLDRLKEMLTSAQLWLAGGAVLVAASFLLDYVHVQKSADRVMAIRQGPPPAVAISQFDPSQNLGVGGELQVTAEIGLDNPLVLDMGTTDAPDPVALFPLFESTQDGSTAFGVLVHRPDNGELILDARALVSEITGVGEVGLKITASGIFLPEHDYRLAVQGALAHESIAIADKFVALQAFNGGRAATLARLEESPISRLLFWTGVAMALFAVALSFRVVARDVLPWAQDSGEGTAGTQTRRFQPLAPQGELQDDHAPANDAGAPHRRGFGSLFGGS